jgi:hypothetical protein
MATSPSWTAKWSNLAAITANELAFDDSLPLDAIHVKSTTRAFRVVFRWAGSRLQVAARKHVVLHSTQGVQSIQVPEFWVKGLLAREKDTRIPRRGLLLLGSISAIGNLLVELHLERLVPHQSLTSSTRVILLLRL